MSTSARFRNHYFDIQVCLQNVLSGWNEPETDICDIHLGGCQVSFGVVIIKFSLIFLNFFYFPPFHEKQQKNWFRSKNNIANNNYQLNFCLSVISLVSGASEVAKIAKNETMFTDEVSNSRHSFKTFCDVFRNFWWYHEKEELCSPNYGQMTKQHHLSVFRGSRVVEWFISYQIA